MSTLKILSVKVAIGLVGLSRVALGQNDNPTGPAGAFNGYSTTAGEFDPYTANATRTVVDLSVPGGVGAYPLVWTRTMNSRHVAGPTYDFGEGGAWQHSYNWGADGGLSNAPQPTSYTVYYPDVRVVTFAPRTSATVDPNYRAPAGSLTAFNRSQTPVTVIYCLLTQEESNSIKQRRAL